MSLEFHKIFPVELKHGTLIVVPEGDAVGFRDSDINRELNAILELLKHSEGINLVVDLGASRYFGSIIIGAIFRLAQETARCGGKAVLCNASDDMLQALDVMKLNQLWPHYSTRKEALKALTK